MVDTYSMSIAKTARYTHATKVAVQRLSVETARVDFFRGIKRIYNPCTMELKGLFWHAIVRDMEIIDLPFFVGAIPAGRPCCDRIISLILQRKAGEPTASPLRVINGIFVISKSLNLSLFAVNKRNSLFYVGIYRVPCRSIPTW